LVERHTRYVMLAKVAGKDTRTVVAALISGLNDTAKGCLFYPRRNGDRRLPPPRK
jgi:hypothetical protein